MKPARFAYADPETVGEVLSLLAEHGDAAKVLAGGQSLVPLLNMRLAMPEVIVDINRVRGLDGLSVDGGLSLGALVRQRRLERLGDLSTTQPLLAEAIQWVGHAQIRTRGTVVGSIAHADPAAEMPVAFLALGGRVELASTRGTREVNADDFFVHIMTTAAEPDELVTKVWFPSTSPATNVAFVEVARRHGDFAIVAVACVLTVEHGVCTSARIAMGGVGPTPLRAGAAENLLMGERLTERTFAAAGRLAARGCDPPADIHASSEYRREVAGALVERALTSAYATPTALAAPAAVP